MLTFRWQERRMRLSAVVLFWNVHRSVCREIWCSHLEDSDCQLRQRCQSRAGNLPCLNMKNKNNEMLHIFICSCSWDLLLISMELSLSKDTKMSKFVYVITHCWVILNWSFSHRCVQSDISISLIFVGLSEDTIMSKLRRLFPLSKIWRI